MPDNTQLLLSLFGRKSKISDSIMKEGVRFSQDPLHSLLQRYPTNAIKYGIEKPLETATNVVGGVGQFATDVVGDVVKDYYEQPLKTAATDAGIGATIAGLMYASKRFGGPVSSVARSVVKNIRKRTGNVETGSKKSGEQYSLEFPEGDVLDLETKSGVDTDMISTNKTFNDFLKTQSDNMEQFDEAADLLISRNEASVVDRRIGPPSWDDINRRAKENFRVGKDKESSLDEIYETFDSQISEEAGTRKQEIEALLDVDKNLPSSVGGEISDEALIDFVNMSGGKKSLQKELDTINDYLKKDSGLTKDDLYVGNRPDRGIISESEALQLRQKTFLDLAKTPEGAKLAGDDMLAAADRVNKQVMEGIEIYTTDEISALMRIMGVGEDIIKAKKGISIGDDSYMALNSLYDDALRNLSLAKMLLEVQTNQKVFTVPKSLNDILKN